jgi:putative MFS transporter
MNTNKMLTLDDLIETKLTIGYYQIIIFILLSMIDMADGAQIAMTSLTLPAIQKEFGLSAGSISLLSSVFFVGTALGSFSVGKFSDSYGRKRIIQVSLVFQILNPLAFSLCNGFFTLLCLRLFYGFCYGFSLPLTTIYITEILPKHLRGKWVVLINFFVTIGNIYGTLMAYFVMESLDEGNWRLLLAYTAILPFVTLIGTLIYLQESMRFLLSSKRLSELKGIFNGLVRLNNSTKLFRGQTDSREINDDDLRQLAVWADHHIDDSQIASYSVLFRPEWLRITLLCWTIWFFLNFMFFGQISLLPYIFNSENKGIGSILISLMGEAPVTFIMYYMIEHPNFGRKQTVFIFAVFSAVLNLLVVVSNGFLLVTVLFWTRLFMKGMFAVLHPYTSEIYPTSFRSVGYGLAGGVGRIGASIMPFVVFPCFYISSRLPFWIFAFGAIICAVCSTKLPYDTTGRNLDMVKSLNTVELVES